MAEKQVQIVVLGAGYAGLMAAIRLAGKTRKQPVQVTLVNAGDHFVERPRLHEVATGNAPRQKPLAGLLEGSGVQFRQGYVTGLDTQRGFVSVENDGRLEQVSYDYLVYALGSRVDRSGSRVRRIAWPFSRHWPSRRPNISANQTPSPWPS